MRIVFFGTPDSVLPVLAEISKLTKSDFVSVVTNPDRPVGRKQILTPSPVKKWAQEHQILVLTPEKLDSSIEYRISNLHPDLAILAAYGKIIPKELIDLFPKGILVIHPSLLPKYRGASPVQAAIANGNKETGVSIIQMDEEMDHGPIVSQFNEPIRSDDTAETLYKRLFQEAAKVLMTILPAWIEGRIETKPQDHAKATYTKTLKKEDGFIPYEIISKSISLGQSQTLSVAPKFGPFNLPTTAENLERFIRAMAPWPGAFTSVKLKMKNEKLTKRMKILKAHLKEGKLTLDLVQLESKTPVSWQEFQKNYPRLEFSSH